MRIIVRKGACRPSFEMKMERRMRLLLLLFCAAVLRTCESSNETHSCVAAGFNECCEIQESQPCQLDSGCRCDRSCYISDNCCSDIETICSADLCTPNPCQNNGVCVTTSMSDYTCQCMYGFAGELCETDIDFCNSSPCLNNGNCTDGIFTFTCHCRPGFSGRQCQDNIDECENSPCQFGTCIDGEGEYVCVCAGGYTGVNCGLNIDDCDPNPCVNGECIDGVDEYTCNCDPSFAGADCSIMTECSVDENTCQNNGLCNVTLEGGNRETFCICLAGYAGDNCETDINECAGNPCLNGGTCIDLVGGYSCNCPVDFTGQNCSVEIDLCNPTTLLCQNGAVCREGECFCRNGFTGTLCQIDINDCLKAVCYNNATCIDDIAGFTCLCSEGFTGEYCNISIFNLCSTAPCLNDGTCEITSDTEYSCTCSMGFTGTNCSEVIDVCLSAPCDANNTESCTSTGEQFECVCLPGFTGLTCGTQIDECAESEPCVNGQCINMVNNYTCICDDGYQGRHCEDEIQECISNPCLNNATCVDLEADYLCLCPMGYTGRSCDTDINECDSIPCANDGVCMDMVNGFECMCPNGFTGDTCQFNIDDCSPNPCRFNSTCIDEVANYTCDCVPGYEGRNCTIDIDLCDPLPCMNGGSCTQNLSQGVVVCSCPDGFQGESCQSDINECNTTSSPCMNGGTCNNTYGGFYCDCPSGFTGETCDVNMFDDCEPGVCMNNATCVDTGDEFECICPLGYEGEICDHETLECSSDPCQNDGICHDEFLNFTCTCTADYTGRVCDINLNPCSSLPCMNGAECTNGEPGSEQFSCQCSPGYTGPLCDEDIDECDSKPCPMGSTCINMINNFTCECASGFGGRFCDINLIDDCDLPYCLNGGTCEDIGDDYICMCDSGFTGLNCEFGTNECLDNPCFNNGICRDLHGSYECICPPGFTGPACEMDMDECDGVNCNNGTCRDLVNGFSCDCTAGYVGERCETEIDECTGVVCLFGGTCRDLVNNYTCECAIGFQGRHCEENIDDCAGTNCGNGTCQDLVDGYYCQCLMGYTGSTCDAMINECDQQPCMNNASCVDALNNFTCLCLEGFEGRYCEVNIDECDYSTCLNGGTCIDGINSYTCECVFGYGDEDCGMLLDFCAPDSCINGGTCMTTAPGTAECFCTQLYTGSRCQDYIDLCQGTNLCLNGGECISVERDGTPAFECNCVGPYRGNLCQIFDPCMDSPCSNNGTCVADNTTVLGYQCSCISPFLGYQCMYLDLCLLNQPCLNGGTCSNNLPSLTDVLISEDGSLSDQTSTCLCSPEFTGRQCETEITPCYYLPCENGGTCVLDSTSDLGYICQCSLAWHGINCSEELNIVTPSFTGASYLSHTLPMPPSAEFNYSLALLTTELSGLLLYVGLSRSYIALGLESGQVLLYLGTESDSLELRLQVNISDNDWHIVLLHVNTMEAVLQVDSEVERVNFSTLLDIDTVVYVGGVPDFALLPSHVSQTAGLVGCVHDRMYNGESVELSAVDHEGRDIGQCLEPLCSYIDCQNGADCSELTVVPGFECECLPLYSGVYCEIPLQVCDPNPCQFGGLCREVESTFSCQCPLGRGGRTCDEGLSISVPSFSGDSFVTYPSLSTALLTLTITITFTPTASTGVLFFVSTSEMEFYDYFSLALIDGKIEFRYNLGTGDHLVRSETPVELYTWHVVTATLSSGRGELTVDNEPLIEGDQSIFTILNTQSNVWLGGYGNFVDLTPIVGTADGYRGCILSLTINDVDIDLIINADNGYGVTQCNTSSCTNQPCLNGGTCIEEGPSFVCVCPSGVTGTLCSSMTGPCHIDPDLCAEGATCVNSEDGVSFTCLCPVGRDGERCDEDVQILIPEFDSTSFLYYNPDMFGTPLSTVALTFNPATASGLLFHYGDNTKSRDFVSISMIDQRVEYRYDLGSGPAILISDPVDLNEWHHAVVSLSGPNGFLTVDGGPEIANDFEGSLSVLDAAGDVFLGGVSNYSTVSPHVGSEVGFTGCISNMEINGLPVDLLGAAIGGRGIAECSNNTCAGITCNNGGTCHVTGSSGPTCVCTLGFGGPTCDTAIDIQVPYFNGQSYIAYDSLTGVFATTTINIEIRPSSPDGLILFNQQTDRADYVAVILRDGRIEFLYNLGSGTAIISSRGPLEMNVWHTIEVYRNGASGKLIVDGTLPVNGSSPGEFNMLQLGDPLYIGGIRGQLPTHIRGTPGYQGCIRNVSSNGVPLELISAANYATGIEECPLLPCTTSPCLNNGQCFVLSGNGSSGQQCLCSLPFTGDTCSERVESFSQASFNGQSFLQFSASDVRIHTQRISTLIKIVFTPTSLTGLLFYMGPVAGSGVHDYLYIALSGGLVELTFSLGSGEITIATTQPLLVGENYTVTVQRNSRSGVLSVSNGDSSSAESPSGAFYFDSGNTFAAYLGGAPGVTSLTNGRYSSGLSGCITAVSIGQVGNAGHLPFGNATNGSSVETCS